MINRGFCALAILLVLQDSSVSADFLVEGQSASLETLPRIVVSGRVSVIDGRTLWFPADAMLVRLSDIDSCELAQWSFDPEATRVAAPTLTPVACGALAKAWLKRTIGRRVVHCDAFANGFSLGWTGRCRAGSRDLSLELLRVGWARLSTPIPQDGRYLQVQQAAMAARYGMWATYVLDIAEWRRKAIDKTLGRRPQADINLLGDRESEISPPFMDARRQPKRRDR